MLKAGCEVRTGRTGGPSDVAEERRRPLRALRGHDLYGQETLEKLGPALCSLECVEDVFSEVRRHGVLRSSHVPDPLATKL